MSFDAFQNVFKIVFFQINKLDFYKRHGYV
jgi:hypothetical protein